MPVSYNGQLHPLSLPPSQPSYTRPSDWLILPNLVGGEEKFVGLFPVFDDDANLVAVNFEGDYTVDWGDGTVEDFASGVIAEHSYSYSALSPSTETARGYRQAIVSVVPQSGNNLQSIDLSVRHSSISGTGSSCPWLDISLSMPQADPGDSIKFTGAFFGINYLGSLEIVNIYDTGGCESLYEAFSYSGSLKQFTIKSMPQVTDIGLMLSYCTSLSVVILPDIPDSVGPFYDNNGLMDYFSCGSIENMSDPSDLFYGVQGIGEIYIAKCGTSLNNLFYYYGFDKLYKITIEDCSLLETAVNAFNMYSIEEVCLGPTPNLVDGGTMFYYAEKLKRVQLLDLSSLENAFCMFAGCYNLLSIGLPPTPSLLDLESAFDNCYQLEKIYFPNLSSLESLYNTFYSCYNLKSISINSVPAGVIDTRLAFWYCESLIELQVDFVPGEIENAFSYCRALKSLNMQDASVLVSPSDPITEMSLPSLAELRVPGILQSFSVEDGCLSREAIVQIFEDLAVIPPGSESVYVGGNWGASSLSAGDIQIATDKGWVVITV